MTIYFKYEHFCFDNWVDLNYIVLTLNIRNSYSYILYIQIKAGEICPDAKKTGIHTRPEKSTGA